MTLSNMMLSQAQVRDDVPVFRRFNRMYTQFLGTLHERLPGSDYSLAEARVLYELASRAAPTATAIGEGLEMDAGYVSRILARFEHNALLKRKISKRDSRCSELILTAKGRRAFQELNDASETRATDVLLRLPAADRTELIRGMRSIERILTPARQAGKPYILRPQRIGDMGWVVYSESLGYAEQFGWDQMFEALVAKIVAEFIVNYDPGRERCWIAEMDGRHAGHVFLVRHPDEPNTAKLRLLFVEPHARGHGLGDTLVTECIRFARSAGYRKIVLWTQSILTAAHRIYEREGFRCVKQEPHRSFGQDLIGQEWELELSDGR